jgi:hypothetical protein
MTFQQSQEAVISSLCEAVMAPNAMNACMRDIARLQDSEFATALDF